MDENAAGQKRIPLEVVREAMAQYALLMPLRQLAMQVGIGKTALHAFITRRSTPSGRTRRSLEVFYHEAQHVEPRAETEVHGALRVLTNHLPDAAADRVREGIVAYMAAETLALGAELPGWMREE